MNASRHNLTVQSGIALVGVLVIVGLLSMIIISLLFRMQAATTASATSLRSEQAWFLSIIHHLRAHETLR